LAYVTEWITNIILFILLAIVIDLLIPNSSLQRYSKMVIGLLLIVIILTPVLQLFNRNVDELLSEVQLPGSKEEEKVEILIENQKKEIQASQRAYIVEQMAVQMKTQAEKELLDEHGYQIEGVQLVFKDDEGELSESNLEEVNVTVRKEATEEAESREIKRVTIDTTKPIVKEDQQKEIEEAVEDIQYDLAKMWQLSPEKIVIDLEGGEN
jgi:stage III sporulation protein AF